MTVKFQLSTKIGEHIFLVSGEDEDPGVAYQNFRVAAEDGGLNALVESFQQPGVTGAAIAAATAITHPAPNPYQPAAQSAAPAYQPAAPAGIPGAPSCHHGAKTRRTGTNQRGPWVGWFCPSPKGTVDQCKPVFE